MLLYVCRYRKTISLDHDDDVAIANGHDGSEATTRMPWRKVLYEQQQYPDNYVDESFLSDLKVEGVPIVEWLPNTISSNHSAQSNLDENTFVPYF